MTANSIENSPFAIAIVQMVVLILNSILYARQKSALDTEKRDRSTFGPLVQQALTASTAAKLSVDQIEVDHYRRLSAMFASLATEHAQSQARVSALEESLASLGNKLASRDRADSRSEKRAAKAAAEEAASEGSDDDGEVPPSGDAPDSLLARYAIPLAPQKTAAPEARPLGFGQIARKR